MRRFGFYSKPPLDYPPDEIHQSQPYSPAGKAIQFNGDKADATVLFVPKGGNPSQGMTLHYQMRQRSGRWEVVNTQDSGHAASVAPGAANPHGGGAEGPAPDNPHGAMPSPNDLPPTKK